MGKCRQGLKSTLGKQSSGQYSLTTLKNFTQPNHPLQEKISLNQHFVHNFASFQVNKCPIYVQMETGLKIDLRATKKKTVLLNLTQEFYAAQPSSLSKNLAKSAFFHNFASFQVNKCPIYVQMETGLKIDCRKQSSGQYSLTSLKNFTQLDRPLQEKN